MKKSREKVLSVIIPIYNGSNYLKRLIEFIQNQKFENYEVLLVDDGSTDDTYQICECYAKRFPWLRIIHTDNYGVSHARNTGLASASGTWVHFIDADDIIASGMFWDFYKTLCTDEAEIAICGCVRKNLVTGTSEDCGPMECRTLEDKDFNKIFDCLEMEDRYWLLDYVWNKWYRRDILEEHHIRFCEDLSLGEDFVFNAHYFQHISTMSLLKGRYYQYEVGASGLVSRFQPNPWFGRKILYNAQSSLYKSLHLWESNKKWIECQAGQIAFGDIRMINAPNCPLNLKEKFAFIEQMIDSEQFHLILCYLKRKTSFAYKVYYHIFAGRNTALILMIISIEKYIKR